MLTRFARRPGSLAVPVALLGLVLIFCACSETAPPLAPPDEVAPVQSVPQTGPLEILFLGSSYFAFNDLPGLFDSLAVERGKDVHVEARVPLGWSLADHMNSHETREMITSRDWDIIVLQGSGVAVGYPTLVSHNPTSTMIQLDQFIHGHNSATEIMFMMPWSHEDGMLWYPLPHDYFVMYDRIHPNTLAYLDVADIVIAPAGAAWHVIMLEDPPLHYLYDEDWHHASLRGTYLATCTIYASVFRETVVGAGFVAGLPEDEARRFQLIATGTVLEDLELWHLAWPTTSVD